MARFFVVQTVPHRAAIGEIWFDKSSIQQCTCIYTDIRPKCTYTRGNSSCNLFDMFGPWKILKTLQSRRLLQGLIKQREIEFSWDISTGQYQFSSGLLRYLLRYLLWFLYIRDIFLLGLREFSSVAWDSCWLDCLRTILLPGPTDFKGSYVLRGKNVSRSWRC